MQYQKVLKKKAILHHVLPLQSSLTGGNVCSRQMVLLDQDQHLLGEYFHNSWWFVLVDKRKFFGRNPQWQRSPLLSVKRSWFHLVYRYWNTYAIKKKSQNIRHRGGFPSIQGLAAMWRKWASKRALDQQTILLYRFSQKLLTSVRWLNLGCSFL